MKDYIIIVVLLMCMGCSTEQITKESYKMADEYEFNEVNHIHEQIKNLNVGESLGGSYEDYADIEANLERDIDNICCRIKNLNVTFVTPGAGISVDSYKVMLWLIQKYDMNIPNSALINKDILFCSDTKTNRLKYFEEAVYSDHKIIWAIRGGFGSNMIIPDLNIIPVPDCKKTLVGFSDITSLNLFVSQKWGWKAIHAPLLIHLNKKDFSMEKFNTLLDILEEKIDSYEIKEVYPLNNAAKKQKCVSGPLTGGNLTIVGDSIGTCWEIDTKNKVLFLEDINLNPWRIYRCLYHLKEANKITGAAAIVFGRFTSGGTQKTIMRALKEFSEIVDIPVYVTNQFGHGNNNKPLVYNAVATIQNNKMHIKL